MTTPFIGEIQLFGFSFPPYQWAFCNGTLIPIQQNTALFSLLGAEFGGNGQTNFQLPNFAGRAACNQGASPGLSPREIGESFGHNSITLTQAQMPAHSHGFSVFNQNDPMKRSGTPAPGAELASPTTAVFASNASANVQFAPNMINAAGGGEPHENSQPYIAVNFSISLAGAFPSFES